jgi:hypothetical protein
MFVTATAIRSVRALPNMLVVLQDMFLAVQLGGTADTNLGS